MTNRPHPGTDQSGETRTTREIRGEREASISPASETAGLPDSHPRARSQASCALGGTAARCEGNDRHTVILENKMAKKMAVSDPALLEKQRNVVTDEVQLSEPTFHHRVEEGEPRWRLWGRRRPRGALWDHQLVTPRPTGPSGPQKIYFSLVGRMKHPGEERGFCAYSHKSCHKSSLSAACGTMAPSSLTQRGPKAKPDRAGSHNSRTLGSQKSRKGASWPSAPAWG